VRESGYGDRGTRYGVRGSRCGDRGFTIQGWLFPDFHFDIRYSLFDLLRFNGNGFKGSLGLLGLGLAFPIFHFDIRYFLFVILRFKEFLGSEVNG